MKIATLKIEGMHCDACASRIRALAENLPGVQMATVSFQKGEAHILYDPQLVSEGRFAALVHEGGFRVVGQE